MDLLITWWLVGAVAIIVGNYWYELSASRIESVLVGFVAGFCTMFMLDISGWI